ncbi:MAG: methyltransferase domain-containing protein, partial [Candidatus Micrarchaeota archaeon]
VIASDVLEHIEDERAALAEWTRILHPRGTLVVFVPAFMSLWSAHDDANGHFRRYSGSALRSALDSTGLAVRRLSYWNALLLLPAAIRRIALRGGDDLRRLHPLANSSLGLILRAENAILRYADLPFGVSVFAVAGKRGPGE